MALVAPQPKFTAYTLDVDGYVVPLVGGKLYSYSPGTSTPKNTYTDSTLGSANTNPVILDANGQANVWFDGATKLILKDSADVTQWTVDALTDLSKSGVLADATLNGTLTISSTAVTWSGNPTHSGNHTFTNNVTINGNTTLGNASTDTLTVAPNAVTWSNNPTHSGNHTWSGTKTVSGLLTASVGLTPGNVARANTETFDYYKRGTFTPGISFGNGTTGITYTGQTGQYTRIGDVCFFRLQVSLTSKGSSTGTARFTGLPFTSASATDTPCSASALLLTGLTGNLIGQVTFNTTVGELRQSVAAGHAVITDTEFTNTSTVYVSGFYHVAGY